MPSLQVDPEPIRHPEVTRQPKGRIGTERTLPMNNLVDPPAGTQICFANLYWLTPNGKRNSSIRISPGWIGERIILVIFFLRG